MKDFFKRNRHQVLKWGQTGLILLVFYFVNVEVQSFFGRRAVEATGLQIHTLNDALTKSEKDNKLVFVDMSAIWCSACRTFDNRVLTNETVKRTINDGFVYSRIEYESEEGEAFMEKYQVSAYPTLMILNPQGDVVKHLNVTFSPGVFLRQLKM